MHITRILVPTDFSADAEAAVRYALDLARRVNALVHVVHVVEDPIAAGMWSSEIYNVDIEGLQINLVRDAERRLRARVANGDPAVTMEVRKGAAAKQILEAAGEWGSDLIVMGTHGRTGFAHMVMGSVAEKVVRLAPCPVLTLRAATTSAPTTQVA
jgi:nucleotide-binding universal stress UspA family protein